MLILSLITVAVVVGSKPPAPPGKTTRTSTTVPTVTFPPCNVSYTTMVANSSVYSNNYFVGQTIDYHVASDSFIIFGTVNSGLDNSTLGRISKSTNATLWSITLCQSANWYLEYVKIDQANNAIYLFFECLTSTPSAFKAYMNKYDMDGGLLWSTEIPGTVKELLTPIEIDHVNSQLYTALKVSSGVHNRYAFSLSNGAIKWVKTDGLYWQGFKYDSSSNFLFGLVYGLNGLVYKFDVATGILTSSTVTLITNLNNIEIDTVGNIYLLGFTASNPGLIAKYDSSMQQLWNTSIPFYGTVSIGFLNGGNTIGLAIDEASKILVMVSVLQRSDVYSSGTWVSTANSNTGSILSYYESPRTNTTGVYHGYSMLIPFFKAHTAFYAYRESNPVDDGEPIILNTFCY